MKTSFYKTLPILGIALISSFSFAQNIEIDNDNFIEVNRGNVKWTEKTVSITDCFIASNLNVPDRFEMSFSAKTSGPEVQTWSGFGFKDRDNRYALGLRGGNNNDLYLCRYQSGGKNKMLALESVDFPIKPEVSYKIRVVFWMGNIRVYLNNEVNPRVVVKDEEYLEPGAAVLGGGWIPTEFSNLSIAELTDNDIADSLK